VGPGLAAELAGHVGKLRRPARPAHLRPLGLDRTVCWLDPDTETFCILFTTQPQEPEGRFLSRICNAVAAAVR